MLRLAIAGANGRVGKLLVETVKEAEDLELAGAMGRGDTELPACEVLIDFSSPEGFQHWLSMCVEKKVAFVSGTTGLAAEDFERLDEASAAVPVLHATNTSLGVALLNRLTAEATKVLGQDFDIEIVESHHRHKKDAPSGTAATLLSAVLGARGSDDSAAVHGRHGMTPRTRGEVGVHSLRMGDVVGEHTVHFAGDGERVELTHRATSRATFARGAIRAARWIAGKPAGRYTMEDVLADVLGLPSRGSQADKGAAIA